MACGRQDGDWGQFQGTRLPGQVTSFIRWAGSSVEIDSYLLTWKAKYSFVFWELRVFKIGMNLEDIILHVC